MLLFTFHYVSILIHDSYESRRRLNHVYIPLCLYFNLCRKNSSQSFLFVYIPLCLYFNGGGIRRDLLWSWVYIPLCLYFNKRGSTWSYYFDLFTFHYVSILIKYFCACIFKFLEFTFHYVSILIDNEWNRSYRSAWSLHSIMSLF